MLWVPSLPLGISFPLCVCVWQDLKVAQADLELKTFLPQLPKFAEFTSMWYYMQCLLVELF